MANAGAPTKYKEEYTEQAYKLCLLGHTDAELGTFFEVDESTINNWKIAHPEFLESIKRGKQIADSQVAQSLFKRALGYKIKEVVVAAITNTIETEDVLDDDFIADEGNGFKEIKVVHKEIAADPTSMIFWLKNRQPKNWRDKQEQGFTDKDGNDVNPVTVFKIPDNERD